MIRKNTLLLLAVAVTAWPQNAADSVQSIIASLRAGNYAEARAAIEEKLKQSPKDSRLWTLDGFAIAHLNDPKQALASYKRALEISPDYLPALEGAAEIEFKISDPHAVVLVDKILKVHPDDQTSHAILASFAVKRGDCNTAIREFGLSRPLIDSRIGALQEYGSCLVKLSRPLDAIPVFQRLTEIQPADEKARYNLAVVQSFSGRYQDAIATLSPSVEKSRDSDALDLLAEAYEAVSDTPRAVGVLRQAIVTAPDEANLYVDFANLCLIHTSFQVGIDMLNAGLKRIPGSAALYLARGILYTQMGLYDQSEADFVRAERLDPSMQLGSAARGMAELQRSNLDNAEATIRDRLRKNPNEPFLHYLLAETLQRQGAEVGTSRFDEAVQSARKAIQLQADFTLARDVLSRLYLRQNKIDEAIEQSRLAFEEDPTDQTALYHYILAIRKRNKSEDVSALTKRLATLREQARAKEAAERRFSLVEVNPERKPASEDTPWH